MSLLKIHPSDTVAVALEALSEGQSLTVDGQEIVLKADIPKGHKCALMPHETGETVRKYGHAIGRATQSIGIGDWVHSHNLASALSLSDGWVYAPTESVLQEPKISHSFKGYRRSSGKVGIRNEIWIICTVGCVARTAQRLAQKAQNLVGQGVDGVYAITHPLGCSQLGDDLGHTRHILSALASHPNAGGVLILGLGCENNQLKTLLAEVDQDQDRIAAFAAQQVDDEDEAGLLALKSLADVMRHDVRENCDLSDLSIGLKCGGSDAFSGLTANPLVGAMADVVVSAGGQVILSEIPEIFGAETALFNRATSQSVFDEATKVVDDFKAYFVSHNQPVYENPSPGNKDGGITTLEEKSLGAVQKGGQGPLSSVIRYGQKAMQKGLVLLEAPGNDAVSSTALAAAGAVMVLFTTGRGTPLGFPVPTVKIASNAALAAKKPHWIDFDASPVLAGEDQMRLNERFLARLLDIASGAQTRNEINGEREIAIWKNGVTL